MPFPLADGVDRKKGEGVKGAGSKEQGAGNKEQGKGHREQGEGVKGEGWGVFGVWVDHGVLAGGA